MGNEIELKFQVAPQDLRRLKASRVLHGHNCKPAKPQNLVSVYFDTTKHKLRKNGVSLRVRRSGDERLQTVKTEGSAGAFSRGDWEHTIDGDAPDLRKVRGTALEPLLTKKVKRNLRPIFATHVRRTSVAVRKNGSHIEVALDEGQIRAGRKSAAIDEVELELKHGNPQDLIKLARAIGDLVPATLALKSKSERGYDLVVNKPPQVVWDQKIELQSGLSTGDAFRIIGRSVLRHISAQEPAVRASAAEGVHQMRVGLRRLRAAVSLFSNYSTTARPSGSRPSSNG
jgi:inorganic triphosphatase YgiF